VACELSSPVIQKLEVESGEIPLFAQALGHLRERSERRSDPT
jgi:hypothetical protein